MFKDNSTYLDGINTPPFDMRGNLLDVASLNNKVDSSQALKGPDYLEEPNPEAIKFLQELKEKHLPSMMEQILDRYNDIAPRLLERARNPMIWPWLAVGVENTMLPSVDKKRQINLIRKDLITHKELAEDLPLDEAITQDCLMSIAVTVMIDDIVDQLQDRQLLDQVLAIVQRGEDLETVRQKVEDDDPVKKVAKRDYLTLIHDVWKEVNQEIAQLPRYAEFQRYLQQDYQDLWRAFNYSLELREKIAQGELAKLNAEEIEEILRSNMHIMINEMIMLMGSRGFDLREEEAKEKQIKLVRDFFRLLEESGNLFNDVHTCYAELNQGDIINSFLLTARENKIISDEEIQEILRIQDLSDQWQEALEKEGQAIGLDDKLVAATAIDALKQKITQVKATIERVRGKLEEYTPEYLHSKRSALLTNAADLVAHIDPRKEFDATTVLIRDSFIHQSMHEHLADIAKLEEYLK